MLAQSIPVLVEVRADEPMLRVADEEQPAEATLIHRDLQRQASALVDPLNAAERLIRKLWRGMADKLAPLLRAALAPY